MLVKQLRELAATDLPDHVQVDGYCQTCADDDPARILAAAKAQPGADLALIALAERLLALPDEVLVVVESSD